MLLFDERDNVERSENPKADTHGAEYVSRKSGPPSAQTWHWIHAKSEKAGYCLGLTDKEETEKEHAD
jgi:hypothetical protein